MAFGLQRSGLYYTMVNTHLAAEEAAYIVEDCGARTLITSSALAPLAAALVPLTPAIELRLMAGATHVAAGPHVLRRVRRRVPGRAAGRRGRGLPDALLVGHDRPPQGRAPAAERASPSAPTPPSPPCSGASWASATGDVYLSPAPLYHSAPLVWSMTAQRMGGTVVVMEHFDPERVPGAHRGARGDPRPVRPHHVRPHAQAARRRSAPRTTCPRCARSCTRPHPARPR